MWPFLSLIPDRLYVSLGRAGDKQQTAPETAPTPASSYSSLSDIPGRVSAANCTECKTLCALFSAGANLSSCRILIMDKGAFPHRPGKFSIRSVRRSVDHAFLKCGEILFGVIFKKLRGRRFCSPITCVYGVQVYLCNIVE